MLDLRSTLALAPSVRDALASATSTLLCSIRDTVCAVPALHALATRIEQVLDDEVCSGRAPFIQTTQQARVGRAHISREAAHGCPRLQVFAIRAGVDGFLDVGASVARMRVRHPC